MIVPPAALSSASSLLTHHTRNAQISCCSDGRHSSLIIHILSNKYIDEAMTNTLLGLIAAIVALAGVASAFFLSTTPYATSVGRSQNQKFSPLMLSSAKRTTSDELIPREILFGNPENTSPLLSPDGNHLAYLAPSPDGVMNIFIRSNFSSRGDKSADRMITNEPKRAIRSAAWAYDSSTIFYMQDNDGDENFHLFAVDNATSSSSDGDEIIIPKARDLTPGKDVKAQNIFTNYRYPDEILVGTNQRNPKVRERERMANTKWLSEPCFHVA
jgi:hypothetical protein